MGESRDQDPSSHVRIESGDAHAAVDAAHGARVASLAVRGRELLVTRGDGPYSWGIFPMVPYAGRVRRGRFAFRGRSYRLPITMPPHAIHGTLADAPWDVLPEPAADAVSLEARLGEPWPFRGRVVQQIRMEPGALHATLELTAEEPMPASMGWHPWFRRRVEGASALELDVRPGGMLPRDAEGMPGRRPVPPRERPWDDTFIDVRQWPAVRWPGFLELAVESACRYWVVYDEQSTGVCIEPQTAPPDALNQAPEEDVLVEPGRPLRAAMTLRWRPAEGRAPGGDTTG